MASDSAPVVKCISREEEEEIGREEEDKDEKERRREVGEIKGVGTESFRGQIAHTVSGIFSPPVKSSLLNLLVSLLYLHFSPIYSLLQKKKKKKSWLRDKGTIKCISEGCVT